MSVIDVGAHDHKQSTPPNTVHTTTGVNTTVAGSGFVACVIWGSGGGAAFTSFVDSKGNTWTQIGTEFSGFGSKARLYYCQNGVGSGVSVLHTCTLTLTANGDATIYFDEILNGTLTGLLDVFADWNDDAATPFISGSLTTTQAHDLILAYTATNTPSGTEVLTWGNSFTQVDADGNSANVTGGCAKRYVTATGTYNSTMTSSVATEAVTILIALKELGGAGAVLAATPTVGATATAALTTGNGFAANPTVAAAVTAALTTGVGLSSAAAASAAAAGLLTNFASVTLAGTLYTGAGGILDPNFWVGSVPIVGTVVWYDPTHITIQTNGEIVSDTNNCQAVVQFFDGTNWWVGLVVITPNMVTYANVAATVVAALSSGIKLNAAASALSIVTGALSTGISVAGAANVLAAANGALSTAIPLLAGAIAATSASGSFNQPPAAFAANASVNSTVTDVLTTLIQMASAAASVVTAVAALTTAIKLSGGAAVISTGGANLTTNNAIAAAASVSTSSSANLSTNIAFQAAATAIAVVAGNLLTQISMVANATVGASAAGSLFSLQPLAADVQVLAAATANLATGIQLRSPALATAIVAASLSTQVHLGANALDTSSSTGSLANLPRHRYGWGILTVLSQTVQGARSAFIEESACEVTSSFFDTTGSPYVPVGVRYRVDDELSGASIVPWTVLTPETSDLVNVTSSQNAMISLSRAHEAHQVLIEITDDFGSVSYARAEFDVYRVTGLGLSS